MDRTKQPPPSPEQWSAYQKMFDFFNGELFGGRLPHVILNFSRHAKALGFFAPERWQNSDPAHRAHEISLNPSYLATRAPRGVASTLVHEMCHLEQQVFGKPSRRGYHNGQWGEMMQRVGLVPSSTGAEGGARTGQRVSHYIAAGGPFDLAFAKMPPECLLPWSCHEGSKPESKIKGDRSKTKFTCPGCGAHAWGKPELRLVCGDCEEELKSDERLW